MMVAMMIMMVSGLRGMGMDACCVITAGRGGRKLGRGGSCFNSSSVNKMRRANRAK
jgi:hypothetical protein